MRAFWQNISEVKAGDHICAILEPGASLGDLLVDFFGPTLARNESAVLMTAKSEDARAIVAANPVLAGAHARGSLQITAYAPAAAVGSAGDIQATIAAEIRTALATGKTGVRFACDLSALSTTRGRDVVLAVELALASSCESGQLTCMCIYDVSRSDPAVVVEILPIHPQLCDGMQILEADLRSGHELSARTAARAAALAALGVESGGDAYETILVVEDDPCIRKLVARTLRAQGYRIVEAADAAEALVEWRMASAQIDLLLTDVDMPKMSGIELAEVLRRAVPELPVLFVSGGIKAFAHPAFRPGDRLLAKPFYPRELLRAVREELTRGEAAQTMRK